MRNLDWSNKTAKQGQNISYTYDGTDGIVFASSTGTGAVVTLNDEAIIGMGTFPCTKGDKFTTSGYGGGGRFVIIPYAE